MESDEKLISKVSDIKNVVSYHEGSIVSRTIIKKSSGTITFFAFDKGEALSEHTAPFDAMVHIIDGKAEVKISGKPFAVSEGEMIILPAGEPHALTAIERFMMILTMIKS